MKQYEAVQKVMEQNGGYATLGHLYEHVLDVPECDWKTETPFASIRRIVQVHPDIFFKVKPGLWALTAWRDRLPPAMQPAKKETEAQREFSHTYYQGLIVQVGNLQNFETHVPPQDKNRAFLNSGTLGRLASLPDIYPFSWPERVDFARTVDVVWFNSRKMLGALYEVEHTTDMKGSLLKYVELQDFRADMFIVADKSRSRQFEQTLSLTGFQAIRKYVQFWSYQDLSEYHAHLVQLRVLESRLSLRR
jgi:hypothetical protein